MYLIRMLPVVALLAVLAAGCGGASDPARSGTSEATTATGTTSTATGTTSTATGTTSTATGTTTTPERKRQPVFDARKVPKDGKITKADIAMISSATSRITMECVLRRTSKEKVARPMKGFRSAIDVLIAHFKDTPTASFKRVGVKKSTTMHATLVRLGNSLARPAPKGCGSNSFVNGGTISVRKRIRDAILSR